MGEELIRKSDALKALTSHFYLSLSTYQKIEDAIKDIPPVNAKVAEIKIRKKSIWLITKLGFDRNLTEVFFTREEAEKALEEMKNE